MQTFIGTLKYMYMIRVEAKKPDVSILYNLIVAYHNFFEFLSIFLLRAYILSKARNC